METYREMCSEMELTALESVADALGDLQLHAKVDLSFSPVLREDKQVRRKKTLCSSVFEGLCCYKR